jgi:hypothetical protein
MRAPLCQWILSYSNQRQINKTINAIFVQMDASQFIRIVFLKLAAATSFQTCTNQRKK